jgi:hypothetical protein
MAPCSPSKTRTRTWGGLCKFILYTFKDADTLEDNQVISASLKKSANAPMGRVGTVYRYLSVWGLFLPINFVRHSNTSTRPFKIVNIKISRFLWITRYSRPPPQKKTQVKKKTEIVWLLCIGPTGLSWTLGRRVLHVFWSKQLQV